MRAVALAIAVVACGGGGGGGGGAVAATGDSLALSVDTAPVEPQQPEPVRGRLVARAEGPEVPGGSWRARAGPCEHPRSLHIASGGDSVDVLLLLLLPDSGPPERTYPVVQRDSVPSGEAHARVGVQRVGYQVSSFQGIGGSVTLERLNRTASGQFDVKLREVLTWDTVRYLGVFAELPVESLPPEVCGEAADSARPAPDA